MKEIVKEKMMAYVCGCPTSFHPMDLERLYNFLIAIRTENEKLDESLEKLKSALLEMNVSEYEVQKIIQYAHTCYDPISYIIKQ